jgi:crotonobetainyl-CoA:carnitine CoA-transferase CaiB-like acyl-CoA transferase
MEIPAMTGTSRPLDGIRILDFSRVLAGPLSTALLADLGAEVIKVEPPTGDDYRVIGPMKNGISSLFTALNRNKKSLTLDLKHPQAAQTIAALAQQVDVVVENFRPGVAERLGVGPEALRRINPGLVYVSVSGFGQTGPLSHQPAYDIIVQAMSGLMEATGEADGPPTMVGEAVSDVIAGLFASWATLAALLQKQRTGEGQHVDVAMFDTTLSFLVTAVGRYIFTGQPAGRHGNRHAFSAPFGVYRAADGHFALAVLNNKLFATLAQLIGQPALASDARFATDELRSARAGAGRRDRTVGAEAPGGRSGAPARSRRRARRAAVEHRASPGVGARPGARPAARRGRPAPAGPARAHPAGEVWWRRAQQGRARARPGRAHRCADGLAAPVQCRAPGRAAGRRPVWQCLGRCLMDAADH